MQMCFLAGIRDVAMAAQTDVHRVGLGQSRLRAGMGIVAVGAIAGRSRMLYFRGLNFLCLLVVAGDAERFDVFLRENNFAVLRRRVAHVAALVGERRMHELCHQLGRC